MGLKGINQPGNLVTYNNQHNSNCTHNSTCSSRSTHDRNMNSSRELVVTGATVLVVLIKVVRVEVVCFACKCTRKKVQKSKGNCIIF